MTQKLNLKLLIAASAILICFTSARAQRKNYQGSFPVEVMYTGVYSYEGNAKYEYIDNADNGRIYDGSFFLTWGSSSSPNVLYGNFTNDKADGKWTFGDNRNECLEVTYKNGIPDGPCTFSTRHRNCLLQMNFKNGRIDGDFCITHFNDKDQPDGELRAGSPIFVKAGAVKRCADVFAQ